MFIDLTAAYYTAEHRGLVSKLLQLLPDRRIINMMLELVYNCSYTLTTGHGKRSRLRHLKNDVLHGSVLAPLLFDVYIHDFLPITSRLYAYADYLAIVHPAVEWTSLERTPNQDMANNTIIFSKVEIKTSQN